MWFITIKLARSLVLAYVLRPNKIKWVDVERWCLFSFYFFPSAFSNSPQVRVPHFSRWRHTIFKGPVLSPKRRDNVSFLLNHFYSFWIWEPFYVYFHPSSLYMLPNIVPYKGKPRQPCWQKSWNRKSHRAEITIFIRQACKSK